MTSKSTTAHSVSVLFAIIYPSISNHAGLKTLQKILHSSKKSDFCSGIETEGSDVVYSLLKSRRWPKAFVTLKLGSCLYRKQQGV